MQIHKKNFKQVKKGKVKGGAHPSPFDALLFPDLKKIPI